MDVCGFGIRRGDWVAFRHCRRLYRVSRSPLCHGWAFRLSQDDSLWLNSRSSSMLLMDMGGGQETNEENVALLMDAVLQCTSRLTLWAVQPA